MRNGAVAALLIVVAVVGAGAGYLTGNANERTTTTASISIATSTILVNETITTSASETSLMFLNAACYGTASDFATGKVYPNPCWSADDPAYVFNSCQNLLAGPPAPHTCTYSVSGPLIPTYAINITLGVRGQAMEPMWDNCSWAAAPKGLEGTYAMCIPVINSTAFIMGDYFPSLR